MTRNEPLVPLGEDGAPPQPPGLNVLECDGVQYIVDVGIEHPCRVLGWYYGYPACCVEAFIERNERWHLHHTEFEPRPAHPVSGHLLCQACETGPCAPLPSRPAERYGFAHWPGARPAGRQTLCLGCETSSQIRLPRRVEQYKFADWLDEDELLFEPPSTYDGSSPPP